MHADSRGITDLGIFGTNVLHTQDNILANPVVAV